MQQRRGRVHYATAPSDILHGAPCAVEGFVGVAVKQGEAPGGTALGDATIKTIESGDPFVIRTAGLVLADAPPAPYASLVAGDVAYIDTTTFRLRAALGQNEKQTLVVKATGGTYTITYSGQTTAAIAYNASAAAVMDALELLSNVADDGTDIHITGGAAEVQTVTLAATDGTFRLAYGGEWTAALDHDISTANLATALKALGTIGPDDVAVGGSVGAWTVTFTGDLRNQDVQLMQIDGAALIGVTTPASVAETTKGTPYLIEFVGTKAAADQTEITCNSGSLTGASHTAVPATVVPGRATSTAVKFGLVEGDAGDRGVPDGKIRVNLDAKDLI